MNTITKILKQEAPYLNSRKQKLIHISFLVAFTFVFLSVYNPFNMTLWYGSSITRYIFIGASLFVLSQFLLRNIIGFRTFKLFEMIIWAICELTIIAFFEYVLIGPKLPTLSEQFQEFLTTLRFVFLIIAGPYALSVWYLATRVQMQNAALTTNKSIKSTKPNELLNIKSQNNKVNFAINYDQLLYIRSSGNYLDIYYLKGEKVSKELVRMSLKELELQLIDPNIIKIHRCYLVNKNKISSLKKNKSGYTLHVLKLPDELPVSAGYKDAFDASLELAPSV